MACNIGYVADEETLREVLQVDQGLISVAETPNVQGRSLEHSVNSKRRRMESRLPFDNPEPSSIPPAGLTFGSEMKKLIVSTCRSIVKLGTSFNKLESKSKELEQHRINGTIPKDLLLPKKKSLFEDSQPQVDTILQTAMNSLLSLRIDEISRKMSDIRSRKASLENDLLTTLKSSRDTQLNMLSGDEHSISVVNSRYSLNVHCFYSHLAIARENAFLKSKREAEKEAKKRNIASQMDTSPEVRVIDVLDQRLKQLGLIGKKARSDSSNSRSPAASKSRSRSRSQSASSRSSNASCGSRDSSRDSTGRSRGILKQKQMKKKKTSGKKKTVKFGSHSQKNGGHTTPSRQRGRGRVAVRGSH